jgi:hypothetical protein
MLVQVGIEDKDLDATWVGAVHAFGAYRNVVGHNSGVVAYQADPKTAFDASRAICDGLYEVDERLTRLRTFIKRGTQNVTCADTGLPGPSQKETGCSGPPHAFEHSSQPAPRRNDGGMTGNGASSSPATLKRGTRCDCGTK